MDGDQIYDDLSIELAENNHLGFITGVNNMLINVLEHGEPYELHKLLERVEAAHELVLHEINPLPTALKVDVSLNYAKFLIIAQEPSKAIDVTSTAAGIVAREISQNDSGDVSFFYKEDNARAIFAFVEYSQDNQGMLDKLFAVANNVFYRQNEAVHWGRLVHHMYQYKLRNKMG